MSYRGPVWGSVLVVGMAGFALGLLVAAVIVAGRTPPRPAGLTGYAPPPAETAEPATVTVIGVLPPSTVTARPIVAPPDTTTSTVEVTVDPTTSTTLPDTTTPAGPTSAELTTDPAP